MYLEKYRLNGRTAVVTGGGQAIGLACSEALSEAGASVVIADYNPKAAEEGRDALRAKGYDATIAILNVTDSKGVQALADKLAGEGRPADILVCNAGIARSETPAEETRGRALAERARRQSERRLLVLPLLRPPHAEGRQGLDRQYRLDVRLHRQQAAAAELSTTPRRPACTT